jgi:hypothetical protein
MEVIRGENLYKYLIGKINDPIEDYCILRFNFKIDHHYLIAEITYSDGYFILRLQYNTGIDGLLFDYIFKSLEIRNEIKILRKNPMKYIKSKIINNSYITKNKPVKIDGEWCRIKAISPEQLINYGIGDNRIFVKRRGRKCFITNKLNEEQFTKL